MQHNTIIYVMKLEKELYKIGCTSNFKNRFTKKSREDIIIQINFHGYWIANFESMIHELFENRQIKDETFALRKKDIKLLQQIADVKDSYRFVQKLLKEQRIAKQISELSELKEFEKKDLKLKRTDPKIKKPNHYSILFSDKHDKMIQKLAERNNMTPSEVIRALIEIALK